MRVRLLLDEDVQTGLAKALAAHSVDALTIEELGRRGLSDKEQLRFATSQGRAIFTYNTGDFVKLHVEFLERGWHHRGIIVSKQLPIGEALKRLTKLLGILSAEEMQDRLEFLSNWR